MVTKGDPTQRPPRPLSMLPFPMRLPVTWGTEPREHLLQFPCDNYVSAPDASYFRGISINAPAETVFRWLCQMRVAPYSYDLIDNGGRQSPQMLTPGFEKLEVGQEVMRIFELVEFEPKRHLTLKLKHPRSRRLFGELAVSYLIAPEKPSTCRLIVKLVVKYPPGLVGGLLRQLLPWGDLVMMRKQLLNFKRLAEEMTVEV